MGLPSFIKITVLTFLVKKCKMKLSMALFDSTKEVILVFYPEDVSFSLVKIFLYLGEYY